MTILSELNEEQRTPVLDTEGAVLVLAGAGSGKTRVLTARIAYLVEEKGVPPRNILAITFTNKAANEMKERLAAMTDVDGMWVSTIHSMCVKILRMFAAKRELNENFSIYSEQERAAVIKQAFKECGYGDEDLLKSAKWHISNAKMKGLSPQDYNRENRRERNIEAVTAIYSRYAAHLKKNNALDFDDLLTETRALLSEDEEALRYLAGKFRYIHVDEFQDTNAVQFDIIKLLSSVHGNLFVVGDDDQSIYGWRGAEVENILGFEHSFPKAKTYKLQQNYRSTKAILSLANASISHNRMRKGKQLWTENGEGDKPVFYEAEEEAGEALYAARTISDYLAKGYKFSDFAVLMRINALTRSYEQEFTKYGIPYKVFGGFKFYERKEVKEILAYLRIAANPFDDEAIERIVNAPKRGIGEKTLSVMREYAAREELNLYDAILDYKNLNVNGGTKEKLKLFGEYLKGIVLSAQEVSVSDFVRDVLSSSGLYAQYAGDSDENVTRRANLDEFQNSVDEFVRMNEGATLADYLQQITLYSDTDEMDDGEYVTLATVHAVKGLEFRCVFFCGLEEDIMPTSRAEDRESLEEERRLMYVAITRAKEKLYLTRSKSRFLYGRRELTVRSRFVEELKEELDIKSASAPRFGGYNGGYMQNRRPTGYGGYGFQRSYGGYGGSVREEREEDYPSFGGSSRPPVHFGNAGVPKDAPVRNNDVSRFREGVRVKHARFGEGVVTATRGQGGNLIVTVHFETAGNKDLAAALAPLEIIGE